MRREKISEVIENIDTKYVEEAMQYQRNGKNYEKAIWFKRGVFAACFAVFVFGVIQIVPMLTEEGGAKGKYKYQISGEEQDIEWSWEYKTLGEKYPSLVYSGKSYDIKNKNPISVEILEQKIGETEVLGHDWETNKTYAERLDIYEITGVSAQKLIAAGRNGEYYVYRMHEESEKPVTFGELMTFYGLDKNVEFLHYEVYEGYESQGDYNLKDDEYIWNILMECEEAELDDTEDIFDRSNRNYLSFSVTSEALGVYKRVVYISEDGYFATNIFDSACIYSIGMDAAEKIMEYAANNSKRGEFEPYEYTVSGTVTEIGEEYLLIDDGVLCRNPKDATVYKIDIKDIRIRRYIECTGIKEGDMVVLKYRGEITEENEVEGAYSMYKGMLVDGNLAIPE